MKIITYNVNGLRSRIVPYRSLQGFLSSLDADIVCLQETKLTRQELSADVAIVEGYEAFFSCTRTKNKGKVGYSGVATFCRTQNITGCTSCILPIAADEGFTGMLHMSKGTNIEGGKSRVGCYEEVLGMDTISKEELYNLDKEGRCIVTDHGSFVLFNIYGPNVQPGDVERMEFKLKFYQTLQCRWESLLRKGRRIIVVGDFNISPFPIDSCDPGPEFHLNPHRKWLQKLLHVNGGPFVDAFRFIHGNRSGAYTCWNQASGAEEFNFGTRIDLILAAGLCYIHPSKGDNGHHKFGYCEVDGCDIMSKFKHSKEDNLPRWAGGRSLRLEGSDHVPVYVVLKQQPDVEAHDVPSLAVRFLPHLRGQQKIDIGLESWQAMYEDNIVASTTSISSNEGESRMSKDNIRDIKMTFDRMDYGINTLSTKNGGFRKSTGSLKVHASQKLKVQKANQTSLKSFFHEYSSEAASIKRLAPSICSECSPQSSVDYSSATRTIDMHAEIESYLSDDGGNSYMVSHIPGVDCSSSADFKQDKAKREWKQLMAHGNPVCRGHGEPCVMRIVKKAGPNIGRGFCVCARAQGPSTNPEARCNHFEWVSKSWKK